MARSDIDVGVRCGSCRFYDQGGSLCRRYPPPPLLQAGMPAAQAQTSPVWGRVDSVADWCGEYEEMVSRGTFGREQTAL